MSTLPPSRLPLLALAFLGACAAPPDGPTPEDGRPADAAPTRASSPPGLAAGPEAIVLARVNDHPLTLADALDSYEASHGGGHKVLIRGEYAVRELTGRLVERALLMEEALALGIPEDPRLVEAIDAFRRSTAADLYWQRELLDAVDVPAEEVQAYYEKTGVVLGASLMESATREEALALRERVLAGEDFADLASAHSTDPSRSFGGLLALVRRGDLPQALDEALFALVEPGALTDVVPTGDGWAFARLDVRTENDQRPPAEVMLPRIRKILEDRAEDALRAELEERLEREAGVELVDELLSKEGIAGDAPGESVVARAAGEELRLADLRRGLAPQAIEHVPAAEVAEFLRSTAREWALERAVDQACARTGLLEDPVVVARAEALEREAVLKFLQRDYMYADIEITEEDLRTYYEEHLESAFTRPPELRVSYVVTETEDEARALLERVSGGENLEALARAHSIDPAAGSQEGRSLWMRPGMMLEEVEAVAFGLEPGALGGPIETAVGHFVLQVLERKEAEPLPFEACRATARRRLQAEREREAYARWALRLRDRAHIEIDDAGILRATRWLEENQEAGEAFGPAPSTVPEALAAPPEVEEETP